MKTFKVLFILLFIVSIVNAQDKKIIFLHHSTGGLVYTKGEVADSIARFNEQNGTNYSFVERNFPDKPYKWANYPFDYWKIWINGYCNELRGKEEYKNVECLESLTKDYDVIIMKHCFPGANILEDNGSPDISSERKSLENYKLQYRALREKFDAFPNNDFIVWTLVPLHRLATTPENAGRASEFVDWVKNDWLNEDGKAHRNIHIFDYYSLAANLGEGSNTKGLLYCLKYEYERSHEGSDSHPNDLACSKTGPEFYRYVIKVAELKK